MVDNPLLGTVEDLGLAMVYPKYYLGDVRVTPLLLDVNLTAAEMENILSPLSFSGENTTVLLLPAYNENEMPLPFSDNLAWAETLAPDAGCSAVISIPLRYRVLWRRRPCFPMTRTGFYRCSTRKPGSGRGAFQRSFALLRQERIKPAYRAEPPHMV